jgi:hypothetical protein
LFASIRCIRVGQAKRPLDLSNVLGEALTTIERKTGLIEKLRNDVVSPKVFRWEPHRHRVATGPPKAFREFVPPVHGDRHTDEFGKLLPKGTRLIRLAGLASQPHSNTRRKGLKQPE